MKDFFKWAGAFIAIVILSTVACLAFIKYAGDKFIPHTFDSSVSTVQMSDNSTEVLTSLTDVFQLRQTMMDNSRIDSTFLAMSDSSLSNVVAVLLKRAGNTTKDAIVNEYLAGRSVYDNLPPAPKVESDPATTSDPIVSVSLEKVGTTTVMEAPQTRVVEKESPPSNKDTVINGKKYKQVE
jgi:hypothetical protein